MSTMIQYKNELIRISPKDSKRLEYSTNGGKTWNTRFSGSLSVGEFQDLTDNGDQLLGTTSKGLFYSKTNGKTWNKR